MQHPRLSRITRPIPLAIALAASPLFAMQSLAGTAVVVADGSESRFEYNDSMLRVGTGSNSYAVVRDGSLYTVINEGGNTMVVDAGSMMRGFSQANSQIAPTDFTANVVSLEKTGRTETVAGILGDVYEVTVEEENGEERTEELVLSTDKRAREFRDALFLMMEVAASATSQDAMEQGADIKSRLDDLDAGVLRFGTQMRLSSIDSDKVDPSRFELPAAPMNLEGLGGMLGAMGQGAGATSAEGAASAESEAAAQDGEAPAKSGGLFSSMMGALGGKADRQADRVGASVDNEVDKETDEAVDKVIGKALGKLFGN